MLELEANATIESHSAADCVSLRELAEPANSTRAKSRPPTLP